MALLSGKKVKLFSLNSNRELAQEIADFMHIELSKCHVSKFSDGEVQVNIDKAQAKGLVKKNTAAREKSRLNKKVKELN